MKAVPGGGLGDIAGELRRAELAELQGALLQVLHAILQAQLRTAEAVEVLAVSGAGGGELCQRRRAAITRIVGLTDEVFEKAAKAEGSKAPPAK